MLEKNPSRLPVPMRLIVFKPAAESIPFITPFPKAKVKNRNHHRGQGKHFDGNRYPPRLHADHSSRPHQKLKARDYFRRESWRDPHEQHSMRVGTMNAVFRKVGIGARLREAMKCLVVLTLPFPVFRERNPLRFMGKAQ